MIDGKPVSLLAESLRRVRTGEATTMEVAQWLRACSDAAASIPMPRLHDAHRKYTRTLLFKNDLFEILALHWLPNSASAIHDHGGALCWLSVARGTIRVDNYLRTDHRMVPGYATIAVEGSEYLSAGALDYRQDDLHVHRCAAGDCSAVTLHVYARPIERFHAFDERANSCSEVISTYDDVLTS